MRKLFTVSSTWLIIFLFVYSHPVFGQLTNNGTITIETNGTLICTGNVQNVAGTITNNGKLEVQGSFINTSIYNSTTADDSLIFYGSGNSDLKGGSSVLNYLWINKTTAEDIVKLTGTTFLAKKLIYDEGVFTTDPINNFSYVLSAPVTAQFSFAAGKEIIGRVSRTSWVNGSSSVFNQPNMQVTTAGGTAPTDVTVTMIPQSASGDPAQNEREVKRKFLFARTGGTGFTSSIRFPYIDAEVNTNNEANLVPWQLISSEWNGVLSGVTRDGSANFITTTGINTTDLANEWKLADSRYSFNATAFLRGPWNGTTMTNALSTQGTLNGFARNQPFNTTPFNYAGTESVTTAFLAANLSIVDWVLVEFRKPTTALPADALSSTIAGRKAGFILTDGRIVNIDGTTPIAFDISRQGGGFITVRHLNHLGVMSVLVPSNTAGTFTNNFSVLANMYKNPSISSNPAILLSGTAYGLWPGDANKSGTVDAADLTTIKQAIANGLAGYQLADINLSSNVGAADLNLSKLIIAASAQGSSPSRPAPVFVSHIPR